MGFDWVLTRDEFVASCVRQPRPGVTAAWPAWLPRAARDRITDAGIAAPWVHQADAAEALYRGKHAVLCTPAGSGKSLGYLLPVIAATCHGVVGASQESRGLLTRRHTALYLSPTKALAHDQARWAKSLAAEGWRVAAVDGDASAEQRRYALEHGSFVLTNPDMLHFSVLPGHRRWARFLGSLRYIVIDEAHRYQGLFGAHVAQVVRRLRRIAAHYGADPTIALASATMPNAAEFASALTGMEPDDFTVFDEDSSPAGARTVALWRPQGQLHHDAASLLSRLSDEGHQSIAFVSSRRAAELVSLAARDMSNDPTGIASYRAGYLASDRRDLERRLGSGQLRGLASTNALELGVDIAGMDAVLIAGYPGTLASFWQQAGRAGRRGQDALVVLLAREDPLDAYLLDHPEVIFTGRVEPAVLYPQNPRVLGAHLAAAAQELPLDGDVETWFGRDATEVADTLVAQKVLRDRSGRRFWTRPERAVDYIHLRSSGRESIDIIERATGHVVGVVDDADADRTLHPGAVYVHQGETYVAEELDRAEGLALVRRAKPRYYTQPQTTFDIAIVGRRSCRTVGAIQVHRGEVRLDSQVVSYLRRDECTHDVWDSTPLDLPRRRMHTQAVWWSVPETITDELGWSAGVVAAAVHAVEHAAMGLLPVFAPCGRHDVAGLSSGHRQDTGLATIFVYDCVPGGAGFAWRGYEAAEAWLAATFQRLLRCPCATGCPACIVSHACVNANQALHKADAARLLGLLIGVA